MIIEELNITECINCVRYKIVFVFFFFQAEDGIRDYKVTGVQTCALPISGKLSNSSVSPKYKKLDNFPVTQK